jgi:hypothetical protein
MQTIIVANGRSQDTAVSEGFAYGSPNGRHITNRIEQTKIFGLASFFIT